MFNKQISKKTFLLLLTIEVCQAGRWSENDLKETAIYFHDFE